MPPKHYLTTREAAERRRKTSQALVMERKRGKGPPYVVDGGRYLYPEDEFEQWLEDRRVEPGDVDEECVEGHPARTRPAARRAAGRGAHADVPVSRGRAKARP